MDKIHLLKQNLEFPEIYKSDNIKSGDIFLLSKRQTAINIASFHQIRHIKHVSEVINILSGFLFGRR